ncbi:MAG: signal peptidase I [Alphaproteobacteria bacterium]|nr:signal peptidase I [Alphaproteobacteria bacterium]
MSSRTSARGSSGLAETAKTIVYAIVIALVIRTFFYEPFSIPSGSMIPTLLVGDYLFVSKFSYGYSRYSLPLGLPLFSGRMFFSPPHRGDVVVFKLPKNPSIDFIKRVIGLPGDRIQMKEGVLYINDKPVKRERVGVYQDPASGATYTEYMETLPNGITHPILMLPREYTTPPKVCDDPSKAFDPATFDPDNTCPYIVPAGHYFMMGDNRDNSSDSRDPSSGVGYVPAENLVGHAVFLFFSTNGYAHWWEFWDWPFTVRYVRLFTSIH